jgi:hypothetical protein
MITILGSLLGFLGSVFPEFLKVYRDTKDREHELAILDRQTDMIKNGHKFRLEEVQVQADAITAKAMYAHARPSGVRWVDALAGSVRPVITYAFFLLYAVMKYSQWAIVYYMMGSHDWREAFLNIWHIEDQALFATVISFWFGQRMMQKVKEGYGK